MVRYLLLIGFTATFPLQNSGCAEDAMGKAKGSFLKIRGNLKSAALEADEPEPEPEPEVARVIEAPELWRAPVARM